MTCLPEKKESQPALLEATSSCMSAVGGVGGFDAVDIHPYKDIKPSKTYVDDSYHTELTNAFVKYSSREYEKKVSPGTFATRKLGNSYTASLFVGLCSLLSETDASSLMGRKIGAFSYGSGICSTLFTLEIGNDETTRQSLQKMRQKLNLRERLAKRRKIKAEEFTKILGRREEMFHIHEHVSYKPIHSCDYCFEEAFVLVEIDQNGRRTYSSCADQKKRKLEQPEFQIQTPIELKPIQENKPLNNASNHLTIALPQTLPQVLSQPLPLQSVLPPECKNEEITMITTSTTNDHTAAFCFMSFVLGGVLTLSTYLVAEKFLKNDSAPVNKK